MQSEDYAKMDLKQLAVRAALEIVLANREKSSLGSNLMAKAYEVMNSEVILKNEHYYLLDVLDSSLTEILEAIEQQRESTNTHLLIRDIKRIVERKQRRIIGHQSKIGEAAR